MKLPIKIIHKDQEFGVAGQSVEKLTIEDLCQACIVFGAKFSKKVDFIGESHCIGIRNGFVVFKKIT